MNISEVLFRAISSDFSEVIFRKGELPILLGKSKKTYFSGTRPLSLSDVDSISNKYIGSSDQIVSVFINNKDFLVFREGQSVVFRYLKELDQKDLSDIALKSACSSSNGLIIVRGDNARNRMIEVYKIISFINNTRSIKIHVFENKKELTIRQLKSHITFFFNPSLDLLTGVRLLNISSYDVLAIPDYSGEANDILNKISKDKLVILGMDQNLSSDFNNVLYIVNIAKEDCEKEAISIKPRVNWSLLMENIREGKNNA